MTIITGCNFETFMSLHRVESDNKEVFDTSINNDLLTKDPSWVAYSNTEERGNISLDSGYIGINKSDTNSYDKGIIPNPKKPPKLIVSPEEYDFGVQSINSLNHKTFVVTNIGEQHATNLFATPIDEPFSFRGSTYPGLKGTCNNALGPNESCTIEITFSPKKLGKFSTTFQISYEIENIPIKLIGESTNVANLRISNLVDDNNYFDFGVLANGKTVTKKFRVIYSGTLKATGVTFSRLTTPFNIIKNDCTDIITSDCDFEVSFYSQKIDSSQTIKLTYHNGAYADETTHRVIGKTSPELIPAKLNISNMDFGKKLIGNTYFGKVLVTNTGTTPAIITSTPNMSGGIFSYIGGNYPGIGGTCTNSILNSCTLAVSFTPKEIGQKQDKIKLTYFNGKESKEASGILTGKGATEAKLIVKSSTIDFGLIAVNQPYDKTIDLGNIPNSVNATNIGLEPVSSPFQYLGGCPSTLQGNQWCKLKIRFKPTAEGSFQEILKFTYFDGGNIQQLEIVVKGEGDSGALLTFSSSKYDFGQVLLGRSKAVKTNVYYYGLLNAEDCVFSIIDLDNGSIEQSDFGSKTFSFMGGIITGNTTCPMPKLNQPCTVTITFIPVIEKEYNYEFFLSYKSGSIERKTSMKLRGKGKMSVPATLSFSQSVIDFGKMEVNQNTSKEITLYRTGDLSATDISTSELSNGFSYAGGKYPGTGGTCGKTLSATQCKLVVNYAPKDEVISSSHLIISYYNGVDYKETAITLNGQGIKKAKLISSNLDFGSLPIDEKIVKTVTITNIGTKNAANITVLARDLPFAIVSNPCNLVLENSKTCDVSIEFKSSKPGNYNSEISINYFDGSSMVNTKSKIKAQATIKSLIDVNGNHSCIRTKTGELKCWGSNRYGQLGLGDQINRGDSNIQGHEMGSKLKTVSLGRDRYVKSFSNGYWHTCAILDDDKLKCWGANFYGQLGLGSDIEMVGSKESDLGDNLPYVDLGSDKVKVVSAGYAHTCAILFDGSVKCWGYNNEGQLGLGDKIIRGLSKESMGDNLKKVELGMKAQKLSLNAGHSCALLEDGSIKCWGSNFFGQLGIGNSFNYGDDPDENLPKVILGPDEKAIDIAAGGAFTCALIENGQIKCWGRNEDGILGNLFCQDNENNVGTCGYENFLLPLPGIGTSPAHLGENLHPIDIGTSRKALAISAGTNHVCALLDDNSVKCWGNNSMGQLGLEDTSPRGISELDMGDNLPEVDFNSEVLSLKVGNNHGCVILKDYSIKCWGNNKFGQLGLGDTNNRGDNENEMGINLPKVVVE